MKAYVFHQDRAFITVPVAMPQGWDEATWINFQQPVGLLVRIDFHVLIVELLGLHGNPYPLDERAKRPTLDIQATMASKLTRNSSR